jgi:hypothetical protein
MPISTINQDGTVNFYNKKTGKVYEKVPVAELGSYSPNLVAEYQSMQTPEKTLERTKAEQELKKIASGAIDLTEGEKTKRNLAKTGLSALKSVKQFYTEDPEIINKQLIPGKFESRSFDASLFGAVDTLLRIRTGATAPEQEIRRYMSAYGPSFGDKPKDVDFKINQLKSALMSEGNLTQEEVDELFPQKTEEKPKLDKEKQIAGKALQMPSTGLPEGLTPLSTPINPEEQVAQQAVGQTQNEQPLIQMPTDLASRTLVGLFPGLQATKIPLIKNILAQRGANVLEKIDKGEEVTADEVIGAGGEMLRNALVGAGTIGLTTGGVISGLTSPGKSIEQRVASAAIEGGTGLALGAAGKVLGRGKSILTGSAKKSAAIARNTIAEATEVKMPTELLKEEANRIAKNLPATASKAKQELSTLKKNISARELVEKIDFWGQAFKDASGAVKDTAAAKLYSSLQRKAKDILAKEAPEILKAHKILQKEAALHGAIAGTAKRFIFPAAIGAGVGIPLSAAVNKALGRQNY